MRRASAEWAARSSVRCGEQMSRIGKMPIPVPSGVEVTIDGGHVTVKANVYGFWMGTLSPPMALCTSLMLTW